MFYWLVLRTGAHLTSNHLRFPPEDVSYLLISCSFLIFSHLLHKQNLKPCLLLFSQTWFGFCLEESRFLHWGKKTQSVSYLSKYLMVSMFMQPWVLNSYHPTKSYVIQTKLLAHKHHLFVCSSKAKGRSNDQLGTEQFDAAHGLSTRPTHLTKLHTQVSDDERHMKESVSADLQNGYSCFFLP